MAVGITLATGVGAAIGAKIPLGGSRLLYASFYGSLSAVDLNTHVLSVLGGGYTNPEDVAVTAAGTVYLTERAGTLLRVDMTQPDRAHATVVAGGLMAPQQIALTADGSRAYVVEYDPAAPGRLLQFDLSITPTTVTVLRTDLQQAVGVIYDDNANVIYITEQAAGGSLSRIDPNVTGAPRTLIATNLPQPFFLTWGDANHTKLLLPLRDPYNRVVSVNLAQSPSTVLRILDGVPFRPSSVTALADGHLVVCSDREITEYDLSTGPKLAISRGLGAGGSLYAPVILSGAQELLISCDMNGLYRSTTGGATWLLQDTRQVQAGIQVSAVYDPTDASKLVSTHPVTGLAAGQTAGGTVTWSAFTPRLAGITGVNITGLAFTPDGQSLLVGTEVGKQTSIYRLDRASGQWTAAVTANVPGGGNLGFSGPVAAFSAGPTAPGGWCFAFDTAGTYWSTDHGATWWLLKPAGVGAPQPGAPFALAVGVGLGGAAVIYVTASSKVWRLELLASASPAAPPPWVDVTGNLSAGGAYDQISVSWVAANTVYVGQDDGAANSPSWTIWQGTYDPATGTMTWRGALDGYQSQAAVNVDPGWIDAGEPDSQPNVLGFGFGGPPHGIACEQNAGGRVLQTNEAFADFSAGGAPPGPITWQQVYSARIQTSNGIRWRTTGLDVTNVWRYYVHPDPAKLNFHFIANTDISLSRSDDSGDTWQLIYPSTGTRRWGNVYELGFDTGTGQMWAAVSTEHDLPYSNQLDKEAEPGFVRGDGAVLVSIDDGLHWNLVGTTFSRGPVLSVIYDGTLYAAVWKQGVYWLDATGAWQQLPPLPGLAAARRLAFDAQGSLICLSSGVDNGAGLYRSANKGAWSSLTASLFATYFQNGDFYPFDFELDPVQPNSYWICTSSVAGGPDGAVYRTDNGGQTWNPVFNFASMGATGPLYQSFLHCTDIIFDPFDTTGQTVYVTTETHGTWYSTNRGLTWQEFNPVPFTATQRLTFDPHDPGTLYTATKGAGAWRTMSAAKAHSIQQQIRRNAYERYILRGGAAGHELDDWLVAQHNLLGPAIRARAYELAAFRGFKPGYALDDWLQAEREAERAMGL